MDEQRLATRIRLGEDSRTELKGVARNNFTIDAHDLAKAIAAFANTNGGDLFLGIEDDRTPTGVGGPEQADQLMRHVAQVCQAGIQPPVTVSQVKRWLGGTCVLHVAVPAFNPDRPHLVQGLVYVRDATESRRATRDEQIRILQSADHHFDEQPVEGSRLTDLDIGALREILSPEELARATGEHAERYLRALRCIDESSVPTVAGLLFLGHDPARWLSDARITAVRFNGTAVSSELADHKEMGGRLPEQLRAAAAFMDLHVPSPSHVEGWPRKEHGIPTEVMREALLNALAHRDYRAASQVKVFVLDDRVEIVNPGVLLNRLTLDSIRLVGISQRRNPVIASLLSRVAGREMMGVRIREMVRLMRARGLPEPEIDVQGGHFRMVLRGVVSPVAVS